MNSIFLNGFLIAAAVLTQSAFAVKTADCPASIKVTYGELDVNLTLKQVFKEMDTPNLSDEETASVERAYANLLSTSSVSRAFELVKPKNGRCVYDGGKTEKIELYSEKGTDKLLMQTGIGPRGVLLRLYATVASVSKKSVELTDKEPSIALAIPRYPYTDYSAGGNLIFVGKVSAAKAIAGK